MRRASALLAALVGAAVACNVTTEPSQPLVTYGIAAYACALGDCTVPDATVAITAADRGDTVWVFSGVEGGNPLLGDSALVRVRADCAANLVLLDGTATVRTIPSPVTCPDSVFARFVKRPPASVEHRYFQWVVDSGLAPRSYALEGRMLVSPNLRPALLFQIR